MLTQDIAGVGDDDLPLDVAGRSHGQTGLVIGNCLLHGAQHELGWDCIEKIVRFRSPHMHAADHACATDDTEAAVLDVLAYQAAFRAAAEKARLGRIA